MPQRTRAGFCTAPVPRMAPGNGVRGGNRNAEMRGNEQRRRATHRCRGTTGRRQLGELLAHGLDDAPATEQRAHRNGARSS